MKKLLLIAACLQHFSALADFSTGARSAFLIDPLSGAEIIAKNADELMPPSSMLKLMTLAVVFDAAKSGELDLDEKIVVPAAADYQNPVWKDASKICLVQGQKISARDAVLGLIVLSGGDAGVALADRLAGGENAMAGRMTARAREIGMPRSSFGNVSGLPDPNNLMSSRELATLAQYLIAQHQDFYPLFATRRFEFGEYQNEWCAKWGQNHKYNYNRLLFIMPGADGLKTGHTTDGGYGMVASAQAGGRRLIGVLNGFKGKNHEALAQEMKKLLTHGFTKTENKVFYNPGDAVAEIPVWYGRAPTAAATVEKPFAITLPRGASTDGLRVLARYEEPLIAPVRQGEKIGEIIAQQNGRVIARADLVASRRVGKIQFLARAWKNLRVIFGGK